MSYIYGTNKELLYANTSVGATLATFTTEAQLNTVATMGVQASVNPIMWPAGPTAVGKAIQIIARGTLASTATPTYTFTVRGGAAGNITTAPILCGSGAIATISGATTSAWVFECVLALKAIAGAGANSTLFGVGRVDSNGLSSTANTSVAGGLTTAGTLVAPGTVTTFDTSITNFINFNVACSVSNAANTVTLQQLLVYGLN